MANLGELGLFRQLRALGSERFIMKYIYGPVKSRRLGFSLGISLTSHKICSFDCVYCQLGPTTNKTTQRKEYVNIDDIFSELKSWLEHNKEAAGNLNYITFSGAGEPTLNIKIGELLAKVKKITNIPLAVITNASLLDNALIRKELLVADLLVPSLDAVNSEAFNKIDRPQQGINIEGIIDGLVSLRREFRGKIWLEIMLVRDLNDDLEHIRKLKEVIARINPDKIQLNSPVRTTCEAGVLSVDQDRLVRIKEILGDKVEVV